MRASRTVGACLFRLYSAWLLVEPPGQTRVWPCCLPTTRGARCFPGRIHRPLLAVSHGQSPPRPPSAAGIEQGMSRRAHTPSDQPGRHLSVRHPLRQLLHRILHPGSVRDLIPGLRHRPAASSSPSSVSACCSWPQPVRQGRHIPTRASPSCHFPCPAYRAEWPTSDRRRRRRLLRAASTRYNRFVIYAAMVTALCPDEPAQLGSAQAGGSGLQDPPAPPASDAMRTASWAPLVCMGVQFCIQRHQRWRRIRVPRRARRVQTAPAQSHASAALDHLPAAHQP